MINKKQEAEQFTIPGGVEGVLYPPGPGGQFSIAVVSQDGVYPAKGRSMNDVCTETMYVQEGRLTVEVDDATYELVAGDVLSITPGQKYRIRGKASTVDVITPAWDKKQNHILEEEL